MFNFRFIGTSKPIKLPDLDFDSYTFRQNTEHVHRETKTVPLIWDSSLSGTVITHPMYDYFKEYLDQLSLGPGHVQTAILIKLPASKSIPSHVDKGPFFRDYHRIHVPIVTNPDCLFTVGDETIHMKPFEMWEINNDNKFHSVTNNGTSDRIHLLIDFAPLKLRLSTHNKLLEFNTFDKSVCVLHEGSGVYYGSFDDWVISRTNSQEVLLNFKSNKKISLPSTFTHDLFKYDNTVFIADCGQGGVVVLENLKVTKHLKPFTVRDHINTVFCDEPGKLWCLLHSLGPSRLVQICTETGVHLQVIEKVGEQSHGIVKWCDKFLILSSGTSELMWGTEVLWQDPCKNFLKGLRVHNNIAYFGAAPLTPRGDRGSTSLQCEVLAFDLINRKLLWRHLVLTCGLLNSIMV
jgi:hypothetical protein